MASVGELDAEARALLGKVSCPDGGTGESRTMSLIEGEGPISSTRPLVQKGERYRCHWRAHRHDTGTKKRTRPHMLHG